MGKPNPATILQFIAESEPLEETLRAYPSVTRADLRQLLLAIAKAARATEARAPERARGDALTGSGRALRVFTDGAARGNPGPAGAGAVILTKDGEVLERLGRYLGRQTNNVAEYQGLLLGLSRALELGAREVEVFSDSELMIRQLQGRYQVRSPHLQELWREAMALLSRFEAVRLVHVLRDQNKEADEMSNRAIDERL